MENITNCPVCNATSFSPFLSCVDYTVSRETFGIVSCVSCGFKFTSPRPEEKNLGEYYKSENYVSHSNTQKGIINWLYQKARKITLLKKLQLISKYYKTGKILDIGSGTGEFLKTMKDAKWNVLGIEPSEDARKMAIKNHQLNVLEEQEIRNLEPESFDVITMWHVLEHVPKLNERVEEINKLLKKDGKAIIAVPNCNSLDAKTYKEKWAAYDLPRHLYHFTPKDMEALFEKHNMKVVKILPMIFDSFYVSMLSEKNTTGKVNLIRSTWNGFRSNIAALKTGKTYSSQIYIITKKGW